MKKAIRLVLGFVVAAMAVPVFAVESVWVYTVQISAEVQASPPRITLRWPQDQYGANSYTVYRKSAGATSWGSGTTLAGTATTYVDANVTAGSAYEYQIVKAASQGYTGYGYIYAGINALLIENRGKVILVVDNTYASQLSSELARLQGDLVGDGWTVIRRDVARNDTPANVRNVIRTEYNADPSNVKAVFLFGHVPIYRSGNLNVDGHQARPMPADAYYGDMDGSWDNPSYLPSDVELMLGRVDLFNMPGNGSASAWPSEVELLRRYLNKDHNFRHKQINPPRRALVGDRFGLFQGVEPFATSAYRNFEPLVGPGNTVWANEQDNAPADQKWTSKLAAGSYLWSYGCGGGSYTSMSGLGRHGQYSDAWSIDIVDGDAKAVFFMMFGSWLGEWDSTDNIMRAALAAPGMGLTCSWAGRPQWYYHHMGLGEPIGYSARLSQNNNSLYRNQVNNFARGVHVALMGDPTLRLHAVAPVSGASASANGGAVNLNWTASADSVQGYHVYRASNANGPFTRLTSSLVSGNSYSDTTAGTGNYTYMIRAVKLESSPSGTYLNPSQGVFVTAAGGGGNGGDTTAPSAAVTAPAHNASVSGSAVTVSAHASDNLGVAGVQFKIDGSDLGAEDTTAPYNVAWNTTAAANGSHTITAVARDAAGNRTTSASLSVVVNNSVADTTPPAVAITAPANNASLSGASVTLSANGSDNVGVAGVQFKCDGANLGAEDTSSPYSIVWNTTQAAAGAHLLTAVARDAAGNRTTSAVVTIVVSNTPGATVYWVDDAVPLGATPGGEGGDGWNWVTSNPAPFAGTRAHQSSNGTNMHQHFFSWATTTLTVNTGETLFAYVYLDPANVPQEVMLQWNDGSWEHRAYWGTSVTSFGVEGTASRRYMGPLPPAGQWARLEVAASRVGLEGRALKGMAFTLNSGRATWDAAGKSLPLGNTAINASLRMTANGPVVSWSSEPGTTYRVEYKNDLSQASWTAAGQTVTAVGTTSTWTDTTAAAAVHRFYRITVAP